MKGARTGDVCTLKYYSQMKYRAGPRRHTARAYIFRPYINTRIIMNARARSVPPLSLSLLLFPSLPMCIVRSFVRSQTESQGLWTRVFSSLYALFSSPRLYVTALHGVSLLLGQT